MLAAAQVVMHIEGKGVQQLQQRAAVDGKGVAVTKRLQAGGAGGAPPVQPGLSQGSQRIAR